MPASLLVGSGAGTQQEPAVAWGNGVYLVAWTDDRAPANGNDIWRTVQFP